MRPDRRTTLQLPHNRLTLDRTFIIVTLNRLLDPGCASGNPSVYGEATAPLKGPARIIPPSHEVPRTRSGDASRAMHRHQAEKPISASIGHAGPVRT